MFANRLLLWIVLAGAHAIDITPPKFAISVSGGLRDRRGQAARDRRHARCVALDDGAAHLALAACEGACPC